MTFKNPQTNVLMEQLHQVIFNMHVIKYLDNKVFDHIVPWDETLAYIAWAIINYYHHTIISTPGQAVFGSYMLFNLASVVDWRFVTAPK